MATAMSKKITALKALLGDEAAKKVVEEAATREKAARDAGVEFKENDEKPVALSTLLDQIDAAIAAGTVVDDVNTEDETPAVDKQTAPTLEQFKEAVTQIVDAKIAALKTELLPAKTEKEKQDEADQAKQKEIDDLKVKQKEVSDKLAELMGEQPRNAGFRASRSETTVKENSAKERGPQPDPLNTFIDQMVFGTPNGNGAV